MKARLQILRRRSRVKECVCRLAIRGREVALSILRRKEGQYIRDASTFFLVHVPHRKRCGGTTALFRPRLRICTDGIRSEGVGGIELSFCMLFLIAGMILSLFNNFRTQKWQFGRRLGLSHPLANGYSRLLEKLRV